MDHTLLKEWRTILTLTQPQAAAVIGISSSRYEDLERGSNRSTKGEANISHPVALACLLILMFAPDHAHPNKLAEYLRSDERFKELFPAIASPFALLIKEREMKTKQRQAHMARVAAEKPLMQMLAQFPAIAVRYKEAETDAERISVLGEYAIASQQATAAAKPKFTYNRDVAEARSNARIPEEIKQMAMRVEYE